MALDPSGLEDAIGILLASTFASAAEAADAWAGSYDDYCQSAQFAASAPVFTGNERAAFAATLAPALAPVPPPAVPIPGTPAAAFGAAVAAYWSSPPIAVAGPQTGTVNGCPGAAALPAALVALCASPVGDAATFAAGFAAALHTATLTVTATVAPPPATIVPIA